jgi:hypothetical protein
MGLFGFFFGDDFHHRAQRDQYASLPPLLRQRSLRGNLPQM